MGRNKAVRGQKQKLVWAKVQPKLEEARLPLLLGREAELKKGLEAQKMRQEEILAEMEQQTEEIQQKVEDTHTKVDPLEVSQISNEKLQADRDNLRNDAQKLKEMLKEEKELKAKKKQDGLSQLVANMASQCFEFFGTGEVERDNLRNDVQKLEEMLKEEKELNKQEAKKKQEQLEKLDQKNQELSVTVRELEKQMLAERETATKKEGELTGLQEALALSRNETGQVLSNLQESQMENVALKDQVKGLETELADSKGQQEDLEQGMSKMEAENKELCERIRQLKQNEHKLPKVRAELRELKKDFKSKEDGLQRELARLNDEVCHLLQGLNRAIDLLKAQHPAEEEPVRGRGGLELRGPAARRWCRASQSCHQQLMEVQMEAQRKRDGGRPARARSGRPAAHRVRQLSEGLLATVAEHEAFDRPSHLGPRTGTEVPPVQELSGWTCAETSYAQKARQLSASEDRQ